ncbi:MAG TPA: MlaD family protein [Caulobacterales bacterium]|nr:MlaD family protein [Caulobacterales bacterium]
METKANYVLIGAATIAGFLLMLLFALWMANASFRTAYSTYDVVFEDPVRGLAVGGEVRFNGIKVGEVKDLRIDPDNTNRVIARINVSSDVPVRDNSEARLEPVGLTGVTLIQLSAGSPSEPLLHPRSFGPPPRIKGRGSQIDQLVARTEDIALRASEAMAAVRDLLTDENIAKVTAMIADLQQVSHRLADQRSVIYRSERAAESLDEAARSITALSNQAQLDAQHLDQVLQELHGASQVASGQTLPQITLAAEEIRSAATELRRVAANLQQNPSVLTPRSPRPSVELDK